MVINVFPIVAPRGAPNRDISNSELVRCVSFEKVASLKDGRPKNIFRDIRLSSLNRGIRKIFRLKIHGKIALGVLGYSSGRREDETSIHGRIF